MNYSLKFKRLHDDVILPEYATEGSAGMDVRAYLRDEEWKIINPGDRMLVKTGLCADIPAGYELQVRSRSGLAIKYGITVLNSPGTIDSDYTDEIGIILINHSLAQFKVHHNDRIAQLVLSKVDMLPIEEIDEIKKSDRGGGFGHTGVK